MPMLAMPMAATTAARFALEQSEAVGKLLREWAAAPWAIWPIARPSGSVTKTRPPVTPHARRNLVSAKRTKLREMPLDNAYPQLPKPRLGRGHLFYAPLNKCTLGTLARRRSAQPERCSKHNATDR